MEVRRVEKKDIPKATEILVAAFVSDPIFSYIFGTRERYDKLAPWMFKTWVNWAFKYGEPWMTDDGNSVLLMRSLENSEMTLWSMIKAGMLPTPYKMGLRSFRRFIFRVVLPLEKKNREIMGEQHHWYGWMVGVKPKARGLGRKLFKHCFKIADERNLPVYLETSISNNVSLFQHCGFEERGRLRIAEGNMDLVFMVRPPQPL
jgi:ribosomal protein S18 acetylase RimI-like enzyme